jgi:hypothetical protein
MLEDQESSNFDTGTIHKLRINERRKSGINF